LGGSWLVGNFNLGMGCCWLMEWALSFANTSTFVARDYSLALKASTLSNFQSSRVPKLLAYSNDFSFLLLLFLCCYEHFL
jgi:hypothetical protein